MSISRLVFLLALVVAWATSCNTTTQPTPVRTVVAVDTPLVTATASPPALTATPIATTAAAQVTPPAGASRRIEFEPG